MPPKKRKPAAPKLAPPIDKGTQLLTVTKQEFFVLDLLKKS